MTDLEMKIAILEIGLEAALRVTEDRRVHPEWTDDNLTTCRNGHIHDVCLDFQAAKHLNTEEMVRFSALVEEMAAT